MSRYYMEFVLNTSCQKPQEIKDSIAGLGEDIEVLRVQPGPSLGEDFKISASTLDPTLIFDVCAQLGRIKTVKIEEIEERA
jgi:dihydroxyacetone kinase-like predicted kinase